MKRKGFTLVELLAVIVIIAIIAVIATPIILNVIESAKKKAALEGFRGYLDAAEKAIILNDLKPDKNFPKADENGCYNLEKNIGLNTYIKIKGTAPTFEEGAKICFTKGNVTSATGLIVDGYKTEYTDGEYYIDEKVVEKEEEKEEDPIEPEETFTGITSGDHAVGSTLTYLGKNWKVMKDNGESTQLVLDGYLEADELKSNLPSDLDSSKVNSSGGMAMCDSSSSKYCNLDNISYTWNKSIVKPTIEKWLDSQMSAQGLTKTDELVGMAFTDGVETINSYVRLPLYDEISSMNGSCSSDSGYTSGSPYCADTSNYMFTNYNYWTLTKISNATSAYFFLYYNNSKYGPGGVFQHWLLENEKIRPVITVKEKASN